MAEAVVRCFYAIFFSKPQNLSFIILSYTLFITLCLFLLILIWSFIYRWQENFMFVQLRMHSMHTRRAMRSIVFRKIFIRSSWTTSLHPINVPTVMWSVLWREWDSSPKRRASMRRRLLRNSPRRVQRIWLKYHMDWRSVLITMSMIRTPALGLIAFSPAGYPWTDRLCAGPILKIRHPSGFCDSDCITVVLRWRFLPEVVFYKSLKRKERK